jgi:hypothetical protein
VPRCLLRPILAYANRGGHSNSHDEHSSVSTF